MTVLDAVATVSRDLPAIRLWCCYGTAPMLEAVERRVSRDAALRDRVHLLGRVSHERVQDLMRAADVFVLASHREGSSFSIIESLACDLPIVVSDIPSSRALLGGEAEAPGILWPRGDAHALAAALRDIARRPRATLRARARFEEALSASAIGRKLELAYRMCLPARS